MQITKISFKFKTNVQKFDSNKLGIYNIQGEGGPPMNVDISREDSLAHTIGFRPYHLLP